MSKSMTKGWRFCIYWSKKFPGAEGIKIWLNESRGEKCGTHGARVPLRLCQVNKPVHLVSFMNPENTVTRVPAWLPGMQEAPIFLELDKRGRSSERCSLSSWEWGFWRWSRQSGTIGITGFAFKGRLSSQQYHGNWSWVIGGKTEMMTLVSGNL